MLHFFGNSTVKFFLALTVLFALLFGYRNLLHVDAISPLSNPLSCNYNQSFTGSYDYVIEGVGMNQVNNGSFSINIPGDPVRALFVWQIRHENTYNSLEANINGINTTITESQHFGPAAMGSGTGYDQRSDLRWHGSIADLQNLIDNGTISGGINNISINFANPPTETRPGGSLFFELFGAALLVIYEDPTLPLQHVQVNCGFDTIFQGQDNDWGRYSEESCHLFSENPEPFPRPAKFSSVTMGTSEAPPNIWSEMYRPQSFWYVTGDGDGSIPATISSLNRDRSMQTVPGSIEDRLSLYANHGSELTIYENTIDLAPNDDYLCVQMESWHDYNVYNPGDPEAGNAGKGSSMAISFTAVSLPASGFPPPSPPPPATNTPTPTPVVYRAWAATDNGEMYVTGIDQYPLSFVNPYSNNEIVHTYFNEDRQTTFDGQRAYLSRFTYLQNDAGSLPPLSSASGYETTAYFDQNTGMDNLNWYDYLSEQVLANTDSEYIISEPDLTTPTAVSQIPEYVEAVANGLDPDEIVVFMRSNDVDFNLDTCDRKAIFIVEGSLTLEPDFMVDLYTNGCMFLVRDTTNIEPGINKNSRMDPIIKTIYDRVDGYFVTDHFVTEADPATDGLYINGSVITNTIDLNRDLTNGRNRYSPAEFIDYDPRYLYIFGDLLSYQFPFHIGESQFLNSIPND